MAGLHWLVDVMHESHASEFIINNHLQLYTSPRMTIMDKTMPGGGAINWRAGAALSGSLNCWSLRPEGLHALPVHAVCCWWRQENWLLFRHLRLF